MELPNEVWYQEAAHRLVGALEKETTHQIIRRFRDIAEHTHIVTRNRMTHKLVIAVVASFIVGFITGGFFI